MRKRSASRIAGDHERLISPFLAWPSLRSLRSELFGASHRVKALGGGGALDSSWSNI